MYGSMSWDASFKPIFSILIVNNVLFGIGSSAGIKVPQTAEEKKNETRHIIT